MYFIEIISQSSCPVTSKSKILFQLKTVVRLDSNRNGCGEFLTFLSFVLLSMVCPTQFYTLSPSVGRYAAEQSRNNVINQPPMKAHIFKLISLCFWTLQSHINYVTITNITLSVCVLLRFELLLFSRHYRCLCCRLCYLSEQRRSNAQPYVKSFLHIRINAVHEQWTNWVYEIRYSNYLLKSIWECRLCCWNPNDFSFECHHCFLIAFRA